jgi:hypothetical protein
LSEVCHKSARISGFPASHSHPYPPRVRNASFIASVSRARTTTPRVSQPVSANRADTTPRPRPGSPLDPVPPGDACPTCESVESQTHDRDHAGCRTKPQWKQRAQADAEHLWSDSPWLRVCHPEDHAMSHGSRRTKTEWEGTSTRVCGIFPALQRQTFGKRSTGIGIPIALRISLSSVPPENDTTTRTHRSAHAGY